ncbi:type VI secretion system needle syringe protein TssI [Syntrophotalea carbinolica DSM 2380]|uniref:Type VI secretion system needle syringe protein TssI n=1 Tax=Syntrophotalea carbinolica (strain DSM 2380 / NBRC 103641 / GraBd1) TaxID=338963 RepID=Q3A0Q1_SYNC1|nr:type VI secretion system tip protein TssI/VgrG [Syntrophotalea carbinolica]ABA90056.1 type VI secretion system needle syringe protein TssI [Syntrophotalea carbinolica DSM 2380]
MTPQNAANLSLNRAANISHFGFRIRSVPDDTFTVTGFSGKDHGISQDFRFTLTLTAQAELTASTVVGNRATMEMRWGGTPLFLHGLVDHFSRENDTPEAMCYQVIFTSPLSLLKQNTNNRVFLNRTVPQIIGDILRSAGFEQDDYAVDLTETYPLREFVIQYAETDFAFLCRLLARSGIFFMFESDAEKSRPRFCDRSAARPALPGVSALRYQPQTGTARAVETIYALHSHARLLPGTVRVTDYNYRTPETLLEASQQSAMGAALGENAVYGDHFKTIEEGQRMASIRAQALDTERMVYVGETDCRGLLPGYRLKITNHPLPAMNDDYLVVSVEHTADQGAALAFGEEAKGPTYTNRVRLIKAATPYRSPIPKHRQLVGTFTARIETTGTEYAYLDEQGRYHIRVDFDRGDAEAGQASHPVRLMQPYGGDNYGIHFPLRSGTEVAVTCVNGDPDRPIVTGALPNPQNPNVVTSDNHTQNIIRTVSGNELLMEDRQGQEKIELFTAERKNILTLDANSDGHKVRLATEEGKMEIAACKTMLIESGDTQTVQSGNDHIVTVENSQRMMTRNKEIAYQAATDFRLKAGDNIQFKAEKQNIAMTAGKDMVVDVARSLSMEVRNSDMELLVNRGNLHIKTARDTSVIGQGGGTITITQQNGTIQITKDGDLAISAGKITIQGNSINLKAGKISEN